MFTTLDYSQVLYGFFICVARGAHDSAPVDDRLVFHRVTGVLIAVLLIWSHDLLSRPIHSQAAEYPE